MPGTQQDTGVVLESPNRCTNCHSGYNQAIEPGFNWSGSMMAQSARDPIFYACMTVAAQDAIWAIGNPNATDLCIRCHFPGGWMEGRSDPTNASLMAGADYDGIHCDFCHRMYDPYAPVTHDGTREGNDWQGYWDESGNTGPGSGTLSQDEADTTLAADLEEQTSITFFGGSDFFTAAGLPLYQTYSENTAGQYFVTLGATKRASFADAGAKHLMLYSRHHKSRYFCGTCHDVSNPVLANLFPPLPDQSMEEDPHLIPEQYFGGRYFHVERTFSEFSLSAFGAPGGAPTNLDFQAQGAPDITHAAKCQDCHMRDVVGIGGDMKSAVLRPTDSTEHPNSGLPLHDMTGGNSWISYILASAVTGSPVYNATNAQLLNQGKAVLTLDMTAGKTPDPAALLAGADRAKQQLQLAATIKNVLYLPTTGALTFRIQNNTGHKLISGFPEGRRMFINIVAYSGGSVVYEVNPYDNTVGTLKGLPNSPNSPPLGPNEVYADELVYEVHPKSDLTGEDETFHFVLATGRYKDNRIPPKGFDIANAANRLCEPVWHGASDLDFFTSEEYAGGYDDVSITLPSGAGQVVVTLYYQGTSREYIEFLRDEINGIGNTLPVDEGDPSPYIAQTDPFFASLRAWGDTIWQLWSNNQNVDGIAPFEMATRTFYSPTAAPPQPVLVSAVPGNRAITLFWEEVVPEPGSDLMGYNIYYDQSGKSMLLAHVGPESTSYRDTRLINGQPYSYKIKALSMLQEESKFSNILTAVPNPPGRADFRARGRILPPPQRATGRQGRGDEASARGRSLARATSGKEDVPPVTSPKPGLIANE
jgi:hypothetical protein